jgi:hypothetical protein
MMPSKVWEVMNDLEMVTAKVVSAREIIDCATDAIQNNDYSRAETLMSAAHEFLEYYLDEFDKKFKSAWQETVVGNSVDDGMRPWGHSDLEYGLANPFLTEDRDSNFPNENKVKKWVLPVEELGEMQFITFPDDLLEAANLKEGDELEWVNQGDGSWSLKKVEK